LQDLGITFTDALTAIDQADIVVLLVDHRQFNFVDPESLKDKTLVDTRGLWTWRKARKPDARIEGRKDNIERPPQFSAGQAA
jgi:UDP-N-acetyl-D-mannosaminuronic acid dehydrogenase